MLIGSHHFVQIALSNLTDASAQKGISYEESLRATARVVSVMLRSWSGLLYLCMDGKQAIASLVQALRINPKEVREIILDMFFELFNVNSPAWQDEILGGLQLNTLRKEKKVPDANKEAQPAKPPKAEQSEHGGGRLNLVDHYLSLLLVVFIEAGLIDALVHVLEHSPENHGRKATLLIGQILHVSNRVLPTSYGVQVHSLPHLFALASKFQSGENRQAATSALSSIDGLNRRLTRLDPQPTARSTRKERSPSTKETMRRGQRQVEKAKIRLGMQIDDNTFRNLLIETQVLSTKDHTKWNFDTLVELLEGPLMNPRRLEEAMRGTKFLRRLLSFFHPFAYRFSSIKKIKANERYVRLGCTMLTMLLSSADGIRFLAEDKLLRQIGDCLMQLDPLAGPPVAKPLMSKSRLEETLTSGYFDMIGTLTNSAEGIRLMERFKMFTTLYHLSELRSRDDLIKAVIENVDYSIDGHPRVVLSKALTSTYKHVRLFATKQLAELIRRKAPEASEWMIWLLLTQLYDPSFEVREMAVRMVEEACASMDVLEMVVAMRPTLDHLGDMGHPLLLKFLSTSVGFRYLWQGEYIDREMDDWFNERNHRYVVQLEIYLARTLAIDRARDDPELGKEFDGTVPPHFYGELAKTDEGCQVLEEKGHFAEFAHFIRQHGMECRDVELISKLKSVLWTVVSAVAAPSTVYWATR